MLSITIPEQHYEFYDDKKNEFIKVDVKETNLQMEHSLKKWEQKWHKPFLKDEEKTDEELIDYFRCMTLTHNVDPAIFNWLPAENVESIIKYIKDPMTATWFSDGNGMIGAQNSSKEIITAEIIYYWMITLMIPVEFEKWHLNQLLTLIKVINIKNNGNKKVDKATAAKRRAALNAERRKKFNSKG